MKRYAILLLLAAYPACASQTTDGVVLPMKEGCIYFFPAGFSSPYNITISDTTTGILLFSLGSGVENPTDTCLSPTGHQFTWHAD